MGTWTYNGRTYSDGPSTPSGGVSSGAHSVSTPASSGGGGGGSHGLSWRDPDSGTIYYNIDRADSSYQTDRVNGGVIPGDATYDPDVLYRASVHARLDANAPSEQMLMSGKFDENYIRGNAIWSDPRFTNSQKSMLIANYYALRAGNAAPYDAGVIQSAGKGGVAGWGYGQGKNYNVYTQGLKSGGQPFISPTMRTGMDGNTVMYKGYANEPGLGAYAQGTQSPTDMESSWERTGDFSDLKAGTYKFNEAGAQAAAAQDITARPLTPSSLPGNLNTAGVTVNTPTRQGGGSNPDLMSSNMVNAGVTPNNAPNGYFDSATGQFVLPGASDRDRTFAALDYYATNGMQANYDKAYAYAGQKGYFAEDQMNAGVTNTSAGGYDTNAGTTSTAPVDTSEHGYGAQGDINAYGEAFASPEGQAYLNSEQGQTFQAEMQTGQQELEATTQVFDDVFAQFDTLQQEFAQYGAEGQAALAASYQQMLSSLDATEASIMKQIKSQMGADDPQMAAAIGIIKDEAKKLSEGLLEEMNTRGVVQSGLYAKAVGDMNANTMTEIQKMITTRVGDLQNQLNTALLNMAQSRMSMMNTYQTNYANFLSQQQQNMAGLAVAGLNARTEYAKSVADTQRQNSANATNLQVAQLNATTSRYNTDQSVAAQKYGYDLSASVERYKADLGMSETQATITANLELKKLEMQNNLDVAHINASNRGGSGGGGITDVLKLQEYRLNAVKAMDEILKDMNKEYTNYKNSRYKNRTDAKKAIKNLAASGVYDQQTLQYAYNVIDTWNPNSNYTISQGGKSNSSRRRITPTNAQQRAAIDDTSGYYTVYND